MKNKVISIVINNYNYGTYLGRCIESALSQSWVQTEVIVVDDGSTDNSRDVISSFGERVISIYTRNCGQGAAYNIGFSRSSGDYVCFLDSDDMLSSDACLRIANVGKSIYSKIQGRLQLIDSLGQLGVLIIPFNKHNSVNVFNVSTKFYAYSSPPGSGNFYSRKFLLKVLPMEAGKWRIAADSYLIFQAPFYGEIHNLPLPVVGYYRLHEMSASAVESDGVGLYKYARKEYLKEIKRISMAKKFHPGVFENRKIHDTPSLIKLRILMRFYSHRRMCFGFKLALIRRSLYAALFWSYYSLGKRIAFFIWVLWVLAMPRFMSDKIVCISAYPYRRGY